MAAEDPIKAQFDILRKRARQAATTATQQEREGLQRRFASIGQVGSGAQIRAEAQAADRAAKRLGQAEETVSLAELGERQRQKEIGEARAFARGEREASQMFGAEQAGLQRRFAAEQAGLGREFARGERMGSQDFAKGERMGSQDFAFRAEEARRIAQESQFGRAQAFAKRQLDTAIEQFDREFVRDSATIEFNKRMAEDAANKGMFDDFSNIMEQNPRYRVLKPIAERVINKVGGWFG